jgi:riboflavin transport system permease protein
MRAHGATTSGSSRMRMRARLMAIASVLAFAALYATFASSDPRMALRAFFIAPFANAYSLFSLFESAAPLLCCALGACIAFRAGAFNLGGEGQAALGALTASLAAAALDKSPNLPPVVAVAAILCAAAASGAILALVSAVAEMRTGAQVMLTSFLLSQAASICVDWAVSGPLKEPGANLLGMAAVAGRYRLALLAPPSPLSLAFPISLALALGYALFAKGTRGGVELRLFGKNPSFAKAVGLSPRFGAWAMVASGALAGTAGAFLVLGQAGRAIKGMTGGVGWNGIAVALIAGSDGLGAVPAALFFSWLDAGAAQASMLADLSPDASAVLKAAALFLITAKIAGKDGKRSLRKQGKAVSGASS